MARLIEIYNTSAYVVIGDLDAKGAEETIAGIVELGG